MRVWGTKAPMRDPQHTDRLMSGGSSDAPAPALTCPASCLATEGALIKGYSARSDLCSTVGAFWASALRHTLTIYVDRVSTDANPADGPSRGDFAAADELGWVRVEPNWGSLMRMHVRPGTGNSS